MNLEFLAAPELQWIAPYFVSGVFLVVASAVGLGPFSGYKAPPMYGDFEAQRHWMEITTNLPCSKWYFYDPEWWGLDYPPLTAFHSLILGKIGQFFDPSWFALDYSRGLETDDIKTYMRATVLASQVLCYIPFVYKYAATRATAQATPYLTWHKKTLAFLLLPSLLIIDNGHFQYNSVMLGLFIGAVHYLQTSQFLKASVLFTMSLFFKQMALFWAPVIFFYILGHCELNKKGLLRLIKVGAVVLGSAIVMLSPWLTSLNQLQRIVHRVFPFARGLWEDKVANFWCATNTFVKYKQLFPPDLLPRLALAATSVAIIPSCVAAYFSRSRTKLAIAFSCCSWAFFLFGFQVHEKSVLLPLVSTSLLMFENNPEWEAMVHWINNIALFSLVPLLRRERLLLQVLALALIHNVSPKLPSHWLNKMVVAGSYAAAAALTLCQDLELISLASKFPDLWVVLNLTLSFACFAYFFLWLHRQLYSI